MTVPTHDQTGAGLPLTRPVRVPGVAAGPLLNATSPHLLPLARYTLLGVACDRTLDDDDRLAIAVAYAWRAHAPYAAPPVSVAVDADLLIVRADFTFAKPGFLDQLHGLACGADRPPVLPPPTDRTPQVMGLYLGVAASRVPAER